MKRLLIIFTCAALVATGVSFGFTYYKQTKNVVATSDTVHVDLLSDHANPSVVSVEKGKYVQFNTKDGKTHDIGHGDGDNSLDPIESTTRHPASQAHEHAKGTKESGAFGKDQAYRVQFKEKGTFTFHDHLHPKISIVVIVYESAKK